MAERERYSARRGAVTHLLQFDLFILWAEMTHMCSIIPWTNAISTPALNS